MIVESATGMTLTKSDRPDSLEEKILRTLKANDLTN